MLSHFLRAAVSKAMPPTLTYNGQYTDSTFSTTHSITGVSFGTAQLNRLVAVYFETSIGTTGTVSSVSIAGISATLAVTANASAQTRIGVIYYAIIPTGTSGTVDITLSAANNSDLYLASYSIYGLNSITPTTTAVSNLDSTAVSPDRSVTFTPNANGLYICGYNAGGVTGGSNTTWTNATEDLDYCPVTNLISTASSTNVANTSTTVSVTNADTSVNRPNLVVAAWR